MAIIRGDAVTVDLERASQLGSLADGDVLIDIENITGSRQNDTIRGDGEGNRLIGKGGDDTIDGRDGDNILDGDFDGLFASLFVGDGGSDHLDGGAGNDQLLGDIGNDTLLGGLDEDQLFGEDGNDTLFGGLDDDQLFGGDGNDVLAGEQGFDRLDGGVGIDTASYVSSTSAVTVILTAAGNGIGLFVSCTTRPPAHCRSTATGRAAAAVQFAQLSAGLALTNLDFLVV